MDASYVANNLGVLLIDCWEPPSWKPWVHQLYYNILEAVQYYRPVCVVDASYGDATKSEFLQPYVTHRTTELETFLSLTDELLINTWVCMGRDWQVCVHYRPLGLGALSKTDLKVVCPVGCISKTNGTFVNAEDFDKDHLRWAKRNDREYQLVGTK